MSCGSAEEKALTKIVINECYGGFGLSDKAVQLLCQYKNISPEKYNEDKKQQLSDPDLDQRSDPDLVRVVEELGKEANTWYSRLQIKSLPKGTHYVIREYDGKEWIETREEIRWKVA